jgi:hypothetical protein
LGIAGLCRWRGDFGRTRKNAKVAKEYQVLAVAALAVEMRLFLALFGDLAV